LAILIEYADMQFSTERNGMDRALALGELMNDMMARIAKLMQHEALNQVSTAITWTKPSEAEVATVRQCRPSAVE
jgi:hypothetical protein